jgi:hypothetical protein
VFTREALGRLEVSARATAVLSADRQERLACRRRAASRGAGTLGVIASIALLGCGGGTTGEVARVSGTRISENALSHWTVIKRREFQNAPKPTPSDLTQRALAFLITSQWLTKEAAGRRIGVSDAEVNASYQRLLNASNGQHFADSLKRRGLSRADELLLLRLAALGKKLRDQVAGGRGGVLDAQQRERLRAFIAAYRERWKRRTTCNAGYVIAECRNGPPLAQGSPGAP